MGYSGWFIVARPNVDVDPDALLEPFGCESAIERNAGWIEGEGLDRYAASEIDVQAIAEALDGPVLLADITTSDYAWVRVASPGQGATDVILTPAALMAVGVPMPGRADIAAAHRAFVAWSVAAPTPVSEADLRALIKRGATLAEDVVWELLSMLGIAPVPGHDHDDADPSDVLRALRLDELGGYRRPLADMIQPPLPDEPPPRDWSSERFVQGLGDDFVGVWDRTRPDAPLYRFDLTSRGLDQALDFWAGMHSRLDLGDDADAFDGLVGIEVGGMAPGGRHLHPRDWRFIPGWGDGFAAVWDREAGPEPVVRFNGRGDRARWRATEWASMATLELLAAKKQLGPDRWISAHQVNPYDSTGHSRAKVFLVAFEDEDSTWATIPGDGFDRAGFRIHELWLLVDGLDISAATERPSPDAEVAKHSARRWGAVGDWARVPDDVPRTLLATARWAVLESPLAASLAPFQRD
jgi:hypothetical protein